jgi:hypothetical protein
VDEASDNRRKLFTNAGQIQSVSLLQHVVRMALLRKSVDGRTAPYPGQTYPATFVTGMPSAV